MNNPLISLLIKVYVPEKYHHPEDWPIQRNYLLGQLLFMAIGALLIWQFIL